MIRSGFAKRAVSGIGLSLMVTACISSMNNAPQLEALQGMVGGSKNYVEAYIEYRGPQEHWAGPHTLLVHVTAREATEPKIVITPELFALHKVEATETSPNISITTRHPASQTITSENVRNQLNQLAAAVQSGDHPFEGCLSPVRVRLIRSDGSVIEKQGCRAQEGWPRAASEAISQFISASRTLASSSAKTAPHRNSN